MLFLPLDVIFNFWSPVVFPGSLILVGGDPGVGKSTLLLQVIFRLRHLDLNMLLLGCEI